MLVMAWYIAALPATEPTSDRRSRRLGIVSLSFGMTGLDPARCAATGAVALQQIRTGFRVRQRYRFRYQAANCPSVGASPSAINGIPKGVIERLRGRHSISGKVCRKVKRRPRGLRFYLLLAIGRLAQPPRRVREQGVDQPRLRGEVAAQR